MNEPKKVSERRMYECTNCGGHIRYGSTYLYWYLEDGGMVLLHPDCYTARAEGLEAISVRERINAGTEGTVDSAEVYGRNGL